MTLSQPFQEVGYCPWCGKALEHFSKQEGGWCPKCEEWFPYDRVKEAMEEEEFMDEDVSDFWLEEDGAESRGSTPP